MYSSIIFRIKQLSPESNFMNSNNLVFFPLTQHIGTLNNGFFKNLFQMYKVKTHNI